MLRLGRGGLRVTPTRRSGQRHAHRDTGWARLDQRGLIGLRGAESVPFLQGLITQDIEAQFQLRDEAGQVRTDRPASLYAQMLNTQGRVLYDAIVFRGRDEDEFLLDVDADLVVRVLQHLKMYKLRRKIDIEVRPDERVWALFRREMGEKTTGVAAAAKSAWPGSVHCDRGWITPTQGPPPLDLNEAEALSSVDPRLPELGHRVLAPVDWSAAEPEWPPVDYLRLRYWLGVPEGALEIVPGKALPLECNVDYLHGVSFHKGCYIGQELTARTHYTGVIRKRIMPIEALEGDLAWDSEQDDHFRNEKDQKIGQLKGADGRLGLGLMRIVESMRAERIRFQGQPVRVCRPHWWPVEPEA